MPTPGVIEYPVALDTSLSLIELLNNASSTLTGNISVGDLLIPVADPGKFSTSGFATLVDSLSAPTKIEIFRYESKSGSNLVVPSGGRGQQGSTAQSFSTGHFVEQRPTARHHTVLADLLIAIEQKLGIGSDTPGGAAQALLSDASGASLWRAIAQADISGLVTALADKISKSDSALQTIISSLRLSSTAPELQFVDTNNSKTMRIALDNAVWNWLNDTLLTTPLSMNTGSDVFTFAQIPLLPASNPTLDNQAARKLYVDSRETWWSMNWFIPDPSTFPLNSFNLAQKVSIPAGTNNLRARFGRGIFNSGSASGSFSVEIRKHPFNNQSGQTTLGTITFNSGSVGVGQGSVAAIDHAFTADDWVYIILTSRSSPLQKDVSISLTGSQTPIS